MSRRRGIGPAAHTGRIFIVKLVGAGSKQRASVEAFGGINNADVDDLAAAMSVQAEDRVGSRKMYEGKGKVLCATGELGVCRNCGIPIAEAVILDGPGVLIEGAETGWYSDGGRFFCSGGEPHEVDA